MEPAGDRWWAVGGAVYMLQAIKRVRGMRLLTPAWQEKTAREKALIAAAKREAATASETCSAPAPEGSSSKLNEAQSPRASRKPSTSIRTARAREIPGPGGWGAVLDCDGTEQEIFGGERATTNNRMELTAVIEALARVEAPMPGACCTPIRSTCRRASPSGSDGWKARGWKTASKEPVKNVDLWKRLDEAVRAHEIDWIWVKGHSGHDGNERADALANKGVPSPE